MALKQDLTAEASAALNAWREREKAKTLPSASPLPDIPGYLSLGAQPQEQEEFDDDPLGFWDGISEQGVTGWIPVLGTLDEVASLNKVRNATLRIQNDEASPEDHALLAAFQRYAQRKEGWGYILGSLLRQIPALAGEFALSGFLLTGAKGVAKKLAKDKAKKAIAGTIRETIEETLERRAKTKAAENLGQRYAGAITKKEAAKQILKRTPIAAADAAAQLAIMEGVSELAGAISQGGGRVRGHAIRASLPDIWLHEGQEGELQVMLDGTVGDLVDSLPEAVGAMFAEVLSERAGGALMAAVGLKAIQTSIFRTFLKKDFARRGINPLAATRSQVQEVMDRFGKGLEKAGWHGMLPEVLEERYSTALQAGMGIAEFNEIIPDWQQLSAEMVAFSVPGAVMAPIMSRRAGEEAVREVRPGTTMVWTGGEARRPALIREVNEEKGEAVIEPYAQITPGEEPWSPGPVTVPLGSLVTPEEADMEAEEGEPAPPGEEAVPAAITDAEEPKAVVPEQAVQKAQESLQRVRDRQAKEAKAKARRLRKKGSEAEAVAVEEAIPTDPIDIALVEELDETKQGIVERASDQGMDIVFVQSKDGKPLPMAGQLVREGVAWVDASAGEQVGRFFGHESVHDVKQKSSEVYEALRRGLTALNARRLEAYALEYEIRAGVELTDQEQRTEEAIATWLEHVYPILEFLQTPEGAAAAERIRTNDPSLWEQLMDWLKGLVGKLGVVDQSLAEIAEGISSESVSREAVEAARIFQRALESRIGIKPPSARPVAEEVAAPEVVAAEVVKPKPRTPGTTPQRPLTGPQLRTLRRKANKARKRASELRAQGREEEARDKERRAVELEARIPKVSERKPRAPVDPAEARRQTQGLERRRERLLGEIADLEGQILDILHPLTRYGPQYPTREEVAEQNEQALKGLQDEKFHVLRKRALAAGHPRKVYKKEELVHLLHEPVEFRETEYRRQTGDPGKRRRARAKPLEAELDALNEELADLERLRRRGVAERVKAGDVLPEPDPDYQERMELTAEPRRIRPEVSGERPLRRTEMSAAERAELEHEGPFAAPLPADVAPPFYSVLEAAIEKSPQKKWTTAQLDKWARKLPGVTEDELKWVNWSDLVGGRKRATKEEVLDWLRVHQIRVQEKLLGRKPMTPEEQGRLGELTAPHLLHLVGRGHGLTEAERDEYLRLVALQEEGEAPHGEWQLPGEKEDYRVLLLTLPVAEQSDEEFAAEREEFERREAETYSVSQEDADTFVLLDGAGRPQGYYGTEEAAYAARDAMVSLEADKLRRREDRAATFTGGHYDEPNVLVHVRFNVRKDGKGRRILFIEEIQSDWHQEGRKKGYRGGPVEIEVRQTEYGTWAAYLEGRVINAWATRERAEEAADKYRRAPERVEAMLGSRVPDAPFKGTWPALAMKRMVKWAADNGFDGVGWTTGAQQIERYESGLRQAVDAITWDGRPTEGEGVKRVQAQKRHAVTAAFHVDERGVIVRGEGGLNDGEAIGETLESVVGKEIAQRIMSEDSGSVSEEGLTIGGHFLRLIYDEKMVQAANKLGKKFGVKAGGAALSATLEPGKMPFGAGWGLYDIESGYQDTDSGPYKSEAEAASKASPTVHFMPLTAEMRSKVSETGFPQFAAPVTPSGVASFFSGMGTVESELGLPSVMSVEFEPRIAKAFEAAHGVKSPPRSAWDVDPKEVAAQNPLLFHASPVCKNFSRANRLGEATDEDRRSAEKVAETITVARPPIVTLEQVPPYQSTALFRLITDALDAQGYEWSADVLNAADYGGAQTRKRLILRAVLDGGLPPLPAREAPGDWFGAISDLLPDAPESPVSPSEMSRIRKSAAAGILDLSRPILTIGSSSSKERAFAANAGGPAPTLKATTKEVPRILMPDGTTKRVTPRMMARLMGLRDSLVIPAQPSLAKTVLGNGVHGEITRKVFRPLVDGVRGERVGRQQELFAAPAPPVDSPEFQAWFGDSKVVDAEGRPLVVYHGTGAEGITAFDPERAGTVRTSDWARSGIYFTPSAFTADSYRESALKETDEEATRIWDAWQAEAEALGTSIMSAGIDLGRDSDAYRRLKEEYEVPWRARLQEIESGLGGEVYAVFLSIKNPYHYVPQGITDPYLADLALGRGYDGIFIEREDGAIEEIIAFTPTQVKSATGQTGAFGQRPPTAAEAAPLGLTEAEALEAQRAGDIRFAPPWHGTGAEFDKFRTEYIGTGEGWQAYGWGLYFTDKRGIAEHYRKQGAGDQEPRVEFPKATRDEAWSLVGRRLDQKLGYEADGYSVEGYIRSVREALESFAGRTEADLRKHLHAEIRRLGEVGTLPASYLQREDAASYLQREDARIAKITNEVALELLDKGYVTWTPPPRGHILRVELAPEEDEYLLWDEPLSGQSEKVREALGPLLEQRGIKQTDEYTFTDQDGRTFDADKAGAGTYRALAAAIADERVHRGDGRNVVAKKRAGAERAASLALLAAGIRGIKYKTGDARGTEREEFNYVLFDEADVEITERFAAPLPSPDPVAPGVVQPSSEWSGWTIPEETLIQRVQRKIQDDLNRLGLVEAQVAEQAKKELRDKESAYTVAEGYHKRAAVQIKRLENAYERPLAKVLKRNDISLDELHSYVYALHAEKRNALIRARQDAEIAELEERIEGLRERGDKSELRRVQAKARTLKAGRTDSGSGITDAEARQVLAEWAGDPRLPAMREAAAIVHKMLGEKLDLQVEGGLVSQQAADRWRRDFGPAYVPLKSTKPTHPGEGLGRRFSVTGKIIHRAKGRGTAVSFEDNIVQQAFTDYQMAVVQGEKNRVAQAFHRFTQRFPDSGMWATRDYPKKRAAMVDETGDPVTDDGVYTLGEKEINVWVEGKRKIITVVDDLLARQMKNLDAPQMGEFIQRVGKVTRILGSLATQWNPGFVLPNFFRDLLTAAINLTGEQGSEMARKAMHPGTLSRALRAAWKAARDPNATGEWVDWYRRYEASGAPVGVFQVDTPAEAGRTLQRLMDEVDPTPLKRAQMLLLDPQHGIFKALGDANTAVENAIRFSSFVAAVKGGASEQQAASLAKNLTVNFNRRGEWGPTISSLYMFFSASVGGTARMFRSLKSPRVRKIVAGIGTMAVVLDVINRSIAGDDDDGENFYDKIPQYIKERNLILMLDDGDYLKIPLPWGFNVFWDAGTQLSATIHGPQTVGEAASHLLSTMYGAFNPVGGEASLLQVLSPTLADPIVQQAENQKFYGAPIRPENYPFGLQKPKSQLYWQSVNPLARDFTAWMNELTGGTVATSGAVDVSPELIEHWVEFVAGGAGKFLSRGAKTFTRAVSGEEVFLKDIPLLRRFAGEADPAHVKATFYDRLEEIEQLDYQVKELRKQREHAQARELRRENATLYRMIGRAKNVRKRVKDLRDRGAEAQADRVMRQFNRSFLRTMEAVGG